MFPGQMSTEELIDDSASGERFEGGSSQDIAAIIFTSGTTGPAKGASISHAALAFQV